MKQALRVAALMLVGVLAPIWILRGQVSDGAAAGLRGSTPEDVARFQEHVDMIMDGAGSQEGFWGVLVRDADSGEVLYALNESRHFVPASNAKLFTTAMALATLGPAFRIQTRIVGAGTIAGEVLQGDLVLIGAGDANLSNRVIPFTGKAERSGAVDRVLAELADQVAARGVKEITGDVVADDSYFERGRFPAGWAVDDAVWSYGSAVSAISVNDNALVIEVRPGQRVGDPVSVSIDPPGGIYEVRSAAVTSAARTEQKLELSREPESRVFYLRGTYPLNAGARPLRVAVPEPAEHAAAMLARLLGTRGVKVAGASRARHAGDPASWQGEGEMIVLAEHTSPPLIEDVRLTNKLSLNLHAELMLRVAAREKAGAMTPDDAVKFADAFRQGAGLQAGDVLFTDGSGLSRKNLVTPEAVVRWLAWAEKQPWGADFKASLSVAGRDGLLENRMRNTSAAGRIQGKTGRLDHVEAFSGYATSLGGSRVIFSILNNNRPTQSRNATEIIDAICIAMIEDFGAARVKADRVPVRATP